MSGSWGQNFRITIFGESHGAGIGVVIDGMEPGIRLDMEEIERQMARRAPGNRLSTPRKEADQVEIVSGVKDGVTCGTPICGMIRNTNTRSVDYSRTQDLLRPSHADYTGHIKYKGFEDFRGGGHFSGRITAPLTFAGALAAQALRSHFAYQAGSHILQIHTVNENAFRSEDLKAATLASLQTQRIPVLDPETAKAYEEAIETARMAQDSVGGIVETALLGLPAGLGDPFFDSLESRLAHLAFAVPAVKGIAFGTGFEFAGLRGSEANDSFCIEDGEIRTRTNHNGGILGGITSGMPVVFRTVFKPTASIAREQQTVNRRTMQEESLCIVGRHDPCIVLRAVPVVEAIAAIAVYDAYRTASI